MLDDIENANYTSKASFQNYNQSRIELEEWDKLSVSLCVRGEAINFVEEESRDQRCFSPYLYNNAPNAESFELEVKGIGIPKEYFRGESQITNELGKVSISSETSPSLIYWSPDVIKEISHGEIGNWWLVELIKIQKRCLTPTPDNPFTISSQEESCTEFLSVLARGKGVPELNAMAVSSFSEDNALLQFVDIGTIGIYTWHNTNKGSPNSYLNCADMTNIFPNINCVEMGTRSNHTSFAYDSFINSRIIADALLIELVDGEVSEFFATNYTQGPSEINHDSEYHGDLLNVIFKEIWISYIIPILESSMLRTQKPQIMEKLEDKQNFRELTELQDAFITPLNAALLQNIRMGLTITPIRLTQRIDTASTHKQHATLPQLFCVASNEELINRKNFPQRPNTAKYGRLNKTILGSVASIPTKRLMSLPSNNRRHEALPNLNTSQRVGIINFGSTIDIQERTRKRTNPNLVKKLPHIGSIVEDKKQGMFNSEPFTHKPAAPRPFSAR